MGAVGHLELGEDVRDVVADSFGTDAETLGDLGVGVVPGDKLQNFLLAVGELGEFLGED